MQTVLLATDRRAGPLSAVASPPMLPVGDRPLAAHAARAAAAAGATELVFAVDDNAGHVQSHFGSRYAGVPVTYAFPDGPGVVAALDAVADRLDGGAVVLDAARLYDPAGVAALFEHDAAVGVRGGDRGSADEGAGTVPPPLRAAVDGVDRGASLAAVVRSVVDDPVSVDVGDAVAVRRPASLVAANRHALAGAPATPPSSLPGSTAVSGRVGVAPDASVAPSATVEGPALVAGGATVGPDAVVSGPAVVGPDAVVESGARVESALLLERATVAAGAGVVGAVLGPGCSLGADASLAGVTGDRGRGAAAVVPDVRPARLRYW